MRFSTFISMTGCAALFAASFGMGCDGSMAGSGSSNEPGSPASVAQSTGYMTIHTAPTTSKDYKEVNAMVDQVEVQDDGGTWHKISTPHRIINLLSLDVEARALLDVRAQLNIGHYGKLRLTLGDGCNVRLADGTVKELRIPAELLGGILIDIDLNVRADLDLDLLVDLDVNAAIQVVVQGGTPCYFFRPCFRTIERALTGEISGILRAKVTGEIFANVEVFAEFFDEAGRPHIAARAMTDAQGHYKLSALQLGRKYHVVCMPSKWGKNYKTFASAEIALSADVSVRALDIDLDIDLDLNLNLLGTVHGTVSPVISLDGCDTVDLVAQLSCGTGCSKWFVVDNGTAKMDGDESYNFQGLPKGKYAVQSQRGRCAAGGACSWAPLWVSADIDVDLSLNLNVFLGINL